MITHGVDMKRIIIPALIVVSLFLSGCASNFISYQDRSIQKIYPVEGIPKDTIFNEAKIWLAESFKNSVKGTALDDRNTGILICNGAMPLPCGTDFRCLGTNGDKLIYTMKIETRDARFRIIYSNLARRYGPSNPAIAGIETDQMIIEDTSLITSKLIDIGYDLQKTIMQSKKQGSW